MPSQIAYSSITPCRPSNRSFLVRVLRQDGPGKPSYWQRLRVPYEADMNCISVLQKIADIGHDGRGQTVAPVAWDCNCLEEVCGACTMVINGRVRQACTALVDRLLGRRSRRNRTAADDQVPGAFAI